jgi:hypothetical protein
MFSEDLHQTIGMGTEIFNHQGLVESPQIPDIWAVKRVPNPSPRLHGTLLGPSAAIIFERFHLRCDFNKP